MLIDLSTIIKYVNINYPWNIKLLFSVSNSNGLILNNPIPETNKKDNQLIEGNLASFSVSPYIMNNIGDDFLQICILILIGFIFLKISKLKDSYSI